MQIEREHSPLIADEEGQARYAAVLADNVKRMRTAARINKKRFSLMVNIGRPFLNKIENGDANPRLAIIERIADAFDSSPAFLLTTHSDEEIRAEVEKLRRQVQQLETQIPWMR